MINQPTEQPLYMVYGSVKRAFIPKIIFLLLLAFIFYLGVLVNISLLELDAVQETWLKTGALLILAAAIVLGMVLTLRKARQPYLFYRNRIAHGKEMLYYVNISSTLPQNNILDKIFKTYSIPLAKKFSLSHVPDSIQLSNYLQQLIEYARNNP